MLCYADGQQVLPGDLVSIGERDQGRVLANISDGLFSTNCAANDWQYLKKGLLIETSFAGLVQFQDADVQSESIKLLQR